jgi:hypothetical protein
MLLPELLILVEVEVEEQALQTAVVSQADLES